MCGIAGMIDLSGQRRKAPGDRLRAMASAIVHRGPDEDGFLELPGLGFASRRLSIVGLSDGRQPIGNEDGSVVTVFNGELFDYPETKARLEARGHVFRTHADTENIVHLWEDHQDGMWDHLKGQFAVALLDQKRQRVVLGRDRFGICPLYWARSGDWLLFGSEIKAILASGLIEARPERRGINHLFTFFALPGPLTCFEGVQLLPPGRFLDIRLGEGRARLEERAYWRLEFPDQGQEDQRGIGKLTDEFEEVLLASVARRLRADVPVVSYLSGGVDSSLVVAMASKIRGTPIPAFTIQIQAKGMDETSQASIVARHVGCDPTVLPVGPNEVLGTYPELIRAAEGPVIDTSCAALLLLAKEVHRQGFKVALTGEGADEWLAGYPWHKVNRALGYLDVMGLPVSQWLRRGAIWASGSALAPDGFRRAQDAVGGHNGWHDIHGLVSLSKARFYSREMKERLADVIPLEEMGFEPERMKRWHPLNRELATGARTHLAGLMLNAKGDRVGMNSSVETRYPFIDEEVFAFLAKVPPQHKYKGLYGDKHILRRVAERYLPRGIAWRKKAMFRAPFDSFHLDQAPPFVHQLLSGQSLEKTGYFDPKAVEYWRTAFRSLSKAGLKRVSVEMGLVGVLATQLWHHTWIDGSLADLPSLASKAFPKPLAPSSLGVA